MATHNVSHANVVTFIESSAFASGDTIMLPSGGGVIDIGKNWQGAGKSFSIINPDAPVLATDSLGPGKTFPALATNSTVIKGTYFARTPRDITVKNCDWTIESAIPDWVGSGETWLSPAYNWGQWLLLMWGGNLTLENCHFSGPAVMTLTNTGYGDCPSGGNYRLASGAALAALGVPELANTAREGTTPWQAWKNPPAVPMGRGLPAGQADYRNVYVHPTFGRLLYNEMLGRPGGVSVVRGESVTLTNCSFTDLFTASNLVCKENATTIATYRKCVFGRCYDDQVRITQGTGSADVSGQFGRYIGCIFTGATIGSGLDLANPHSDVVQSFATVAPYLKPNLLFKNCLLFTGVLDGIRGQRQGLFLQQRTKGLKVIDTVIVGVNKGLADISESPYVVGLRALLPSWFGQNPEFEGGPLLGSIVSVNPDTSNDPGSAGANGYVAGCVAPFLSVSVDRRGGNILYTGNSDGVTKGPHTAAPTTLAAAFDVLNEPTSPKYADITAFLNAADNWSNFVAQTMPRPATDVPLTGLPVHSYKELIHVGDFGATATIEMVTPGLKWREWDFEGEMLTAAATASAGTITDHNRLELIATDLPTSAATSKTYFYKVNGQLQSWSITTRSAWRFPISAKPETGQWQRSSTGSTAILPGATATQKKKGMIWARFAVGRPATDASNKNFLIGTAGRTFRANITTSANGYVINWVFGSSSGGVAGAGTTGTLDYGVVYDHFLVVDLSLATNNVGLVVYDVANPTNPKKPFAITSQSLTYPSGALVDIGWDYNHANNAVNFANGIPIPEFHGLGVWAGESLIADDGTGTGTNVVASPGLLLPEQLGVNGTGLTGTKPAIFLLGETSLHNRGTGNAWTSSATLGCPTWANPPGQGPKLTLAIDPLPGGITVGDTFTVTVRSAGSNEPLTVTPTLGAGLTLVGGPSFAMAENARVASFDVQATAAGKPAISIANTTGYANPPAVTVTVGA